MEKKLQRQKPRWLWMAVSSDRLELPLAVAESAGELAKMLGISVSNVYRSCERRASGKIKGYKIIKTRWR